MQRVVALAKFGDVAFVVIANRPRGPVSLHVEGLYAVAVAVRLVPGIHRSADAELEPRAAVLVAANRREEPCRLVVQVVVDCDLADHLPL